MADEYILKSFDGGAQKTSLTSAFTIGGTTLAVSNGSTFPDGSAGPFVVVVDRGLATEEKYLIDTTSGANGTTFNIQQAGYDGTSASAHSVGAVVEHCLDAYTIEQANRYVNLQTAKGDLVFHNGTTTTKQNIGANNTALIADSTVSTGAKWSTIGTATLADGAVTAAKLATAAVTADKIAADAVTTTAIADGSVTAAKIAVGATPASVPTGVISPFAGTTEPSGWLLCSGQAVSRTTYSQLFAIIGVAYGAGDGSTTFNIPDLRSRFPVGKGTATWSDTLAESGGSANAVVVDHFHTNSNHVHDLAHGHTATTSAGGGDGTHQHSFYTRENMTAGGSSGDPMISNATGTQTSRLTLTNQGHHGHQITVNNASGTTGQGGNANTGSAGVSATNANLPPYITLNYIIKA